MAAYWNGIPTEQIRNYMRSTIAIAAIACGLSSADAAPYTEAGPAVIQVHIEGTYKSKPEGAKTRDYKDDATGFVVSPDGLILTAGHVVPDPKDFEDDTLTIEGRAPQLVDEDLVASDPAYSLKIVKSALIPHDVGLFKIENLKSPLKYLRLCDEYKVDDNIFILGYLGGDKTLASRHGNVSRAAIGPNNMLMQLPMTKGDSGSPVFNATGSVIAIGIGQLTINNERVEGMTFAVLMRNAIAAMSPNTQALIGKSYDPKCDKKLDDHVALDEQQILLNQKIDLPLGAGQTKTMKHTFNAPEGKVFNEIVFADASSTSRYVAARSSASSILNKGKTLEMTVEAQNQDNSYISSFLEKFGWKDSPPASVDGKVIATVKPAPNPPIAVSDRPGPDLRSFLVSKTLEIHEATITRQPYSERIPAPAGYRFKRITGVDVASMSHSPSNGINATVGAEGNFIQVDYNLESGPATDPWKAWIDAFVTARLEPLGK
jgi:serine protease Do